MTITLDLACHFQPLLTPAGVTHYFVFVKREVSVLIVAPILYSMGRIIQIYQNLMLIKNLIGHGGGLCLKVLERESKSEARFGSSSVLSINGSEGYTSWYFTIDI